MLGWLAVGRRDVAREGRGLEHGVVHDATIGRGIGSRRADSVGTVAPDLLELGGGNIRTVVGSDGSPELLAAGFVDGAETVSVNDLGLVGHFGVDTETVVRLRGSTGSKGAGLGKEDLVLGAAGRGGDGVGADMGTASVAHGRAVAGRLRVGILIHGHGVDRSSTGRAARGVGRDRVVALAAVATVRKLVVVQAACKLGLLEVSSNVLVRHLLHAGLKKVVLLHSVSIWWMVMSATGRHTSSSDQDLLPPADIFLARRLEGSGD